MVPGLRPETSCVTSGTACETCPFYPPENAAQCGNLAVGQVFVSNYQEMAYLDNANRSLAVRLDIEVNRRNRVGEDILIPNCFNPSGMRDVLEFDTKLQEAIKRGKKGVVYIDLRGQKFVNDTLGRDPGDLYIQGSHDQFTDAVDSIEQGRAAAKPAREPNELTKAIADIIRRPRDHQDVAPEGVEERRSSPYMRLDKLVRIGGDEFALLLSDISAEDLITFAEELQTYFSVERAIENYNSDPPRLPVIASVGIAHLSTNNPAKEAVQNEDYWTMFRLLCEQADAHHGQTKKAQYQQMWDMSLSRLPEAQRDLMEMPDDPRRIHKLFIETCCPDFIKNPRRYLVPRLRAS